VSTDRDTMSIPLRRSTLALSISLLAGGLLTPASAPARKQGRGTCSVSLEASAAVVTAGETVTLLGQMVCPAAGGAAGESLTVYQRERGSPQSELATVTTGEDGSYQLTTGPLTSNSVFVVRSLLAHSVRTVVRVTPRVTLDGPAADGAELTTRGDRGDGRNRFTFSGTVSPARAGMLVALQREYLASGERWHTIALGRLDGEGEYSITHGFRAPGEVSIRVVVHPPGELAIASEPLSYDISQSQAALLTIHASPDPISPGGTATITGVAAGPAEETLTLLARTNGQPFAPVAKATTEAGGAYSFAVTPPQNTTYRVLSASAESSELFEGVRYALRAEAPASRAQTGVPVTFSGTVLGAPAGEPVHLERRNPSGVGFHVVDSGAVGAGDSYSVVHTFDSAGSEVMRIAVPAGPQTLGSTSPEFTIAVTRQPASPAS
jgi:hypothetical protein